MSVYFTAEYNTEAISLETVNKAVHLDASLRDRPIPGVVLRSPAALTIDDLAVAHDAPYIAAVRSGEPAWLAGSGVGEWHPDLFACATHSNGGVLAAVLEALDAQRTAGSLSSGLHHARAGRGAGFCTFNGLAIAALRAVEHGATRVLILDLDAHCGGGTASILAGHARIEQVDVSVHAYDSYDDVPNARLVIASPHDYLGQIARELAQIDDPASIDVVIYNAGMDPHEAAGGRAGITADVLAAREDMVFAWARAHGCPVAWVLAGGYRSSRLGMDGLVDLHRLTIDAALRHSD